MSGPLEALSAAVEARLVESGLRVYSGAGAEPPYPYVIPRPDSAPRDSDRTCDAPNVVTMTVYAVVVGESLRQARAAVDRAADALSGWRPQVPGFVCHKVRNAGSQPIRKDDSVADRDLWIGTDQWSLVAERTP